MKIVPIRAVHTLRAALKEDQAGLRILRAFRTAAKTVGASWVADSNSPPPAWLRKRALHRPSPHGLIYPVASALPSLSFENAAASSAWVKGLRMMSNSPPNGAPGRKCPGNPDVIRIPSLGQRRRVSTASSIPLMPPGMMMSVNSSPMFEICFQCGHRFCSVACRASRISEPLDQLGGKFTQLVIVLHN